MSAATEQLRKHVNCAAYTTSHRVNCIDVCEEVDGYEAVFFLLEERLKYIDPVALDLVREALGVDTR